MIDSFLKGRDAKNKEKLEEYLQNSFELIDRKLYKKAFIEIKKAMELDQEKAYPKLIQKLERFALSGQYEAAISVGLNILREKPQDYELANQIGNYARKSKDFKQANSLYRHALKINKSYSLALYNLAASMGKIELYDEDAGNAVKTFSGNDYYIYPDYIGDEKYIEELEKKIFEEKKQNTENKIKALEQTLEEKVQLNNEDEIEIMQKKINTEKEQLGKLIPEDFFNYFDQLANKNNRQKKDILYNKGLYALQANEHQVALDAFESIDDKENEYEYLNMNTALAKSKLDQLDQSINMMVDLLGKYRYNRYYNINLGFMYRDKKNYLLSYKYLIIGRFLLNQSEGFYSIHDLLKLANEKYEKNFLKEALNLYNIIANETGSIFAFLRIGQIYMAKNQKMEAVKAYQNVIDIDPNSEEANIRLEEMNQFFISKGDDLARNLKLKPALILYEKALEISRDTKTLHKIAALYRQLKDKEKEEEINEEIFQTEQLKKDEKREAIRKEYITKGQNFLQEKDYRHAIESLENAFRMKLDKEVFWQLANIYKGLKKTGELQNLMSRWNRMVEHEEKIKRYKKQEERSKTDDSI